MIVGLSEKSGSPTFSYAAFVISSRCAEYAISSARSGQQGA